MKLLLVCGPWSSGTTAVAGSLARLGATGLQPTFQTFDERTGDSHESVAFRDLIQSLASEQTLALAPDATSRAENALRQLRAMIEQHAFGPYDPAKPVFLKYPLSALLILPICKVFDTRLIYVIRPFADIEATRQRRGWPAQFGEQGAARIYNEMFALYVTQNIPTLMMRYNELRTDPATHVKQLAAFSRLPTDDATIQRGCDFIRR